MTYIKSIPEDAKLVPNSTTWIDRNGTLYGVETRRIKNRFNGEWCNHKHYGEYFKYNGNINKKNGYVYAYINYTDRPKSQCTKRLHVIVAQLFCENPNNYPVVCHKNNIKSDCRADNLYWGTYKMNTQQAIEDDLMWQTKGCEDSQSKPVVMFDRFTNKELGRWGSICEAVKETGLSKTTIARQCKYKGAVRKPYYFRYQDDPDVC